MQISQLWTYPVKSMVGVSVESVELSSLGIVGDRHWAIRDLERGGIRGAKKIGELMQFTAHRNDNDVIITFPDGTQVSSADEDVNFMLSGVLGRNVLLESLPADNNLEHFRRGPSDSDDPLTELRGIFGREAEEPLPDFTAFPPEVAEFESPPGTHHDCWPLLVMTTSALQALTDAVPESQIDVLRFRPSIVVETNSGEGHVEFSWKGKTAALGTAVIEFLDPCPRCIMITRKVNDELPEDRAILRHVVRDLNQAVGVYARILTPGRVALGDALTFQ
ncbi:MAG: MOSC N-terminal beta barrel domain-containing protein [Actinobacteria bacterium]|nr:MOSC N-terminal beta barrel domain-containing protein [Actinomycetota bacterium]